MPIAFDLEVERDRDEVVLDDLEALVAEEPGPGPGTRASGPAERMAVADPDQKRLALRGRFLPRLP